MNNEISVTDLHEKLNKGEDIFLLDVREPHEFAAFNIHGYLIPLGELEARLSEIPHNKPVVVYCRSGQRSAIAVAILNANGFLDAKNLVGGMIAWQQEII